MLVLPYKPRLTLRGFSQIGALAAFALALVSWPSAAAAEDKSVIAAASAFTQGQQAELSGNNERAAELFELADRIAPTPEALRSATRARFAAGQLSSAAADAEELRRRYHDDPQSRELAERVLSRARPELARFTFECSEPCSVVVDGFAAGLVPLKTQVVYVSPGSHELVIGFAGDVTRGLRLQGSAGEARTIKLARPVSGALGKSSSTPADSSLKTSTSRERRGLSPTYFWVAAGTTVVAGALTLWSGLDLIHARDDFKSNPRPTRSEFDDGESKDRRTSVLIGATSALALSTAALAVFTDFSGERRERMPSASLSVDGHGARLSYGSRF
ncbi:MAG: hypothetical protein JWN48_445 [Myxococcaceae bacterium]|nr:hypothetical protein [Myxococcaceae bacterium]